MILRIQSVDVIGPQQLRLDFNNGVTREVDVRPLLSGPIFLPLLEASYFALVKLDPVCGTVVWPNGADFAPEALLAMPQLTAVAVTHEG